MITEFKRETLFSPAYDKRPKGYGIHGVELTMLLRGPLGSVQFKLYTNWQLPHVTAEMMKKPRLDIDMECFWQPMPADLGYHSPKKMYKTQETISEKCEMLEGGPCYYDGSGLNADRIYNILLEKGSEGVWKELEDYYRDTFIEQGYWDPIKGANDEY